MTIADAHGQTVATVYDQSAIAYEQHWAPALHRHALDLVAAVPATDPHTPRTVVDVATGTGTLLPSLHRLAGPGGRVLALDRSRGMLQRAPSSTPRVQADAVTLHLATGSIDVLVLAFVLFLLPEARPAIIEATRVLRPGGWFLAATWGTQLGTGADLVAREELDRAGAPAFPPLARSDAETDSAEDMANLLGDGFEAVRTAARPLDARFTPTSALAMRTGCGTLGWRYARLGPEAQARVSRRAADRLCGLPDESSWTAPRVLLTTARRR